MAIATIDPSSGLLVKRFDAYSGDEIETALAASAAAFETLRRTPRAPSAQHG